MSAQVKEGDKVHWNWGSGQPSGTAAEVKADDVTIVSHRGNEITKHGKEGNPAVHVERPGNDVVKLASELTVDKKAEGSSKESNGTGPTNGAAKEKVKEKVSAEKHENKDKKAESKKEDKKAEKNEEKSEPEAGDKRKADKKASEDDDVVKDDEAEAKGDTTKKQKTTNDAESKDSAPAKRKPGRPKGSGSTANGEKKSATTKAKKEKKEPIVGKAARKTRSQGNVE